MKPQQLIRNFCIIAHIDHGKSTLADRFLELTGTVSERERREQVLDSMELERERGVTIKASAVTLLYAAADGEEYELNLIDTPGHVDFAYEVSRALTACEGALLVVDASQGIEAQTLAHLSLALEHDLEIIPVVNKIDLPVARTAEVKEELTRLMGLRSEEILEVSARQGTNVREILEAVVRRVPAPRGDPHAPLRALIFDSHYDSYKGVVAYVRLFDGRLPAGETLKLHSNGVRFEPLELGHFRPALVPAQGLAPGQVGYVATGLKDVHDCRVGDTLTSASRAAESALPGYQPAKPMVFAGLYTVQAEDFPLLRDALEKLKLNDAALEFQPEESGALGFGYRCGFLGLFHMEIVQERLEREFGLELLATAPSVAYRILLKDGREAEVDSPVDLPDASRIQEIREPWMRISVYAPDGYIGPVMELVTRRRGAYSRMEYLSTQRVLLEYEMPLSEMLTEFYDQLKSATRGYASLDYQLLGYRKGDLVRLQILVNGLPVDALSVIVHRREAEQRGRTLVEKLKDLIPRHQFPVPLQAAIGGKVIARETVKALRKNVLAKCYGGDVTRKRKLLERQKEGKKRMRRFGEVDIPQEAFLAVLRLGE